MATTTEKLGLKKPAGEDYISIDDINNNMDIVDQAVQDLQEDIASTKKSVSDGKTLVADAITAKGIDTAADATFATMAENIEDIVTLENGTDDATATAEQILLDMKAYVKGLPVIGTMPNNGAVSGALNCGGSYKIPKGYHDGNGVITANSLASQTVGTATAAQILSGKTAWANGEQITGTIQSQAAQTITPGTSNKTIVAGKYLSGVQTIKGDSNLKADNIKRGVSIFGVSGNVISRPESVSLESLLTTKEYTVNNRKTLMAADMTDIETYYLVGDITLPDVPLCLYNTPESVNGFAKDEKGVVFNGAIAQIENGEGNIVDAKQSTDLVTSSWYYRNAFFYFPLLGTYPIMYSDDYIALPKDSSLSYPDYHTLANVLTISTASNTLASTSLKYGGKRNNSYMKGFPWNAYFNTTSYSEEHFNFILVFSTDYKKGYIYVRKTNGSEYHFPYKVSAPISISFKNCIAFL